jgi:hypothetical protein
MKLIGSNCEMSDVKSNKKYFIYHEGRLHFSSRAERRLLFYLTLVMLLWGILEKIGIM